MVSSFSGGCVVKREKGENSRDKVFVCKVCNRCFSYKHVLLSHERTHTGEKPFECRQCHKRFSRKDHLNIHMRLHTGDKPYQCTQCERKFAHKTTLKAHMFIHNCDKVFKCKNCLEWFRRKDQFIRHKCSRDEVNIGKPRSIEITKSYDTLNVEKTDLSHYISSPSMTIPMPLLYDTLSVAVINSKQFQADYNSIKAVEFVSTDYNRISSPKSITKPSNDLKFSSLASPPNAQSSFRLYNTSTVNDSSSIVASITSGLTLKRKPRQTIRIHTEEKDMTPDLANVTHQSLQQSQQLFNIQTQPLNLSISSH